jgi:hypothetical protein
LLLILPYLLLRTAAAETETRQCNPEQGNHVWFWHEEDIGRASDQRAGTTHGRQRKAAEIAIDRKLRVERERADEVFLASVSQLEVREGQREVPICRMVEPGKL